MLRRLATRYRVLHDDKAANATLWPEALRSIFFDYRRAIDTEMAYTVLRMEPASSNLELSPPGRRSTTAPHPPPEPSPEQRGAKGASKKPKGSRSRGRR